LQEISSLLADLLDIQEELSFTALIISVDFSGTAWLLMHIPM
jgi:hypothetical protein